MKKIALILTLGFIVSCNDDIVDGPAAGFYPTGVLTALEEDGVAYQVTLAATGELSQGGVVQIELDNHEFIETNPPHTNGKLQLNISSSGSGLMTVKALDDDIQGNYISTFRVTDTGGDITGIANSEFSFIVEDDDVIFLFGEDFESGIEDWEVEDRGTGNEWEDGEFSGNAYADVSNFQADGISESWILSPEIDFDAGENEVLTFDTQPRFNEGEETFEAYIVQGYTPGNDPSGFTIRQLSFEVDDHTGGGFGDFASSGEINVGEITGSARIAFYYKAGSAADGSGWSLDNVLISSFHPDNSDGIPNVIGGGGSGGGGSQDFTLPFFDDFESCDTEGEFNIPSNWMEVNVPGFNTDRGWGCRENGVSGSWAPRASAFNSGGSGEDDSWMISNGTFDLTSESSVDISFFSKTQFAGPGKVTVYWSSDYTGGNNPTLSTWNELTDITTQMGSLTESYQEISGDLSGAIGNEIYLAFRYTEGTAASSIAIDIDDLCIGDCGGNGGGGCNGSGNVFSLPFTDDFEGCDTVGDFNIPSNWIEEIVPGSKSDRGWGCREFGRSGWGPRASAFGGADGTDDAWFISDGVFDLKSMSTASLVFWVEERFSGPGSLTVHWSANYAGCGDPTQATWTELTDAGSQISGVTAETWTEITADLDAATGQEIHIAFRYKDGTAAASIAYTIDDLSFTGN